MQTPKKVEERRRKIAQIRRKKRSRLLFFFLVVASLAIVGVALYNSPLFKVKKIKVTGNHRFTSKKIITLSGIPNEVNLFTFPAKKIRERLLRQRWIEEVKIGRNFPNKAAIKVRERKPIALVSWRDSYALIDENSFVLEYRESVEELNLPIIEDLTVKELPLGERIKTYALSNALKCLANLDSDLRSTLSIVSAPSVGKLTLFTNEGVEILYGKAEGVPQKNYALKKILSENETDLYFIDVRVISNPVIRRLSDESPEEGEAL